jgi:hypothetical protein
MRRRRQPGARAALALAGLLGLLARGGGEERPDAEAPARKANRLIHEKSPYLLQHAHNPVDWYPWGEEAFKAARESQKLIFLSIGYSTCHWCHVMERQSFEDAEIAARLNERFIAIKVDREERPDVDEVYMSAVIAVTGHGGWPLSAFLTPEGKPFYLGTYFPPRDDPRLGMGFLTILERISEAWGSRRDEVLKSAESIAEHLAQDAGPEPAERSWRREDLRRGYEAFADLYDAEHGGFGRAPKFPRSSVIDFLLAYHRLAREPRALEMAKATLSKMYRGGIYDHLDKGFHRYSTDARWHVPHFEKMLYDNALIASSAIDAYRACGDAELLEAARGCLGYILDKLADPGGAFRSAEDADSEGEEGKYYVFDRAEVFGVVGEADGALFCERYGITEAGNFEHGKSVLRLAASIDDVTRSRGLERAEVLERLDRARRRLLEARRRRVPPILDDKVLADWNGLAISALAKAHQASGEARYVEAARAAADFIAERLTRDGKLLHRYRDGEARYPGYLDDFAFLANALIDLYEADLDPKRLREAARLAREMLRQFWDEKRGGLFDTGPDHERLIVRTKEFYDGAVPSGNAVAALALQRLADYTADPDFAARAATLARLSAGLFEGPPPSHQSHPQLLLAAAAAQTPRVDVVLVAASAEAAAPLRREVQRRYLPRRTIVQLLPERRAEIEALMPWIRGLPDAGSAGTPYALARSSGKEFQRLEKPEQLGELLAASAGAED